MSEALEATKAREAIETAGNPSEAIQGTPRMSSALQGSDAAKSENSELSNNPEVEEVINYLDY